MMDMGSVKYRLIDALSTPIEVSVPEPNDDDPLREPLAGAVMEKRPPRPGDPEQSVMVDDPRYLADFGMEDSTKMASMQSNMAARAHQTMMSIIGNLK